MLKYKNEIKYSTYKVCTHHLSIIYMCFYACMCTHIHTHMEILRKIPTDIPRNLVEFIAE